MGYRGFTVIGVGNFWLDAEYGGLDPLNLAPAVNSRSQ